MTHLVAALAVTAVMTSAAPAEAQDRSGPCADLPSNIHVVSRHRGWVLDVIGRSETLQRQCVAIGRARHVQVRVDSVLRVMGARARASFVRDRAGRLHASVQIPVSLDFPELLAHELEHVLEQIEALDLRAMARLHGSGVRQVGQGVYETTRAVQAGRNAAREVLACSDAGRMSCGGVVAVMASKD